MRNPSPRTQDDDLSRLTTSSASLRNENNVFYPADDSEDSSTDLESSYLPQIINPFKWQRHSRKRKERQDSTSSIIQDRKLIRSNSEEHLSINGCEIIRRVCSNEEIKCSQCDNVNVISDLYGLKKSSNSQYNDDVCSLKSTNNEVQEILRETHRRTETSPARSRTFDFSYKLRISPNRDAFVYGKADGEEETDGEPEHRRSEERSCKARAAQIPRKSLPLANKKSPSLSRRQLSVQTDNKDLRKGQLFDRMYKYDVNAMKGECRGFMSKELKLEDNSIKLASSEYADNNTLEGSRTESKAETPIQETTPPWDHSVQDDQPVISQRFADNKFDHVNNSRDVVTKIRNASETISMSLAHFSKEETSKVREVMKNTHLSSSFITVEEKIRHLNKRLMSLKKRVIAFEGKFESEYGYCPSLTIKLNDSHIKNILSEIHKLRKEKQALKADPLAAFSYKSDQSIRNKVPQMKKTVEEIEKRLQAKRIEESRSSTLDNLTADQLVQEKAAVQRALLYLESLYGRPNTREERDVARGLYDRYRIIKRLVNRNVTASGATNLSELPTILEHEAMAFPITAVSITPPPSDCDAESAPAFLATASSITSIESPSETPTNLSSTDSTDTSSSINENVHELSIEELSRNLSVVRDEKRRLGRTIKEFEEIFEEQNGRKMLKSDRGVIEDTYALYKQKKAKLRLLDALIKKHLTH